MEQLEREIEDCLLKLDEIGGLTAKAEDLMEGQHETASLAEPSVENPHALRRILRRLDRSLTQLLETEESTLLSDELLTLLTRLEIPEHDESSLELAISVSATVGEIWNCQGWPVSDMEDLRLLLRRILQFSDQPRCILPWLKVLNCQLLGQETHEANIHDTFVVHDTALSVLQLQQLLQKGLTTLHATPQWIFPPTTLAETTLQWHTLTVVLLNQVYGIYAQVCSSSPDEEVHFTDWLEQRFIEANPHQKFVNGIPRSQHLANQLVHCLQDYVNELINFGLDALDGAEALVMDTSRNEDESSKAAMQDNALTAVEYTMRQIMIIAQALKVLKSASLLDHPQAALQLWKSLSTAFVRDPTAAFNIEDSRALGANICHITLLIANISLESGCQDSPVSKTLIMTLLRALVYPEMLLEQASAVWKALEDHVSEDEDVKYALQTSVLTIYSQLASADSPSKDGEEDIQNALAERIVELLKKNNNNMSEQDPWDCLFESSVAGFMTG